MPTPKQFGAKGDGVTADDAAFATWRTYCDENGLRGRIAAGTYLLNANLFAPRAGFVGDGPDQVTLLFGGSTAGDRRLLKLYSYANVATRIKRLAQTADPARPRAALSTQAAGLSQVTCSTASDAALFAKGDIVRVAFSKDPYDANDSLFLYDRVNRVKSVNASTGVIDLEVPIPPAVQSDGFGLGEAYYAPADWANATVYAPAAVCYGSTGSASGANAGVFQTTAGGTSNGTGPLNDVGVVWSRITYDYGSLKNTTAIDGRPVIEKVTSPAADAVLSGFTLDAVVNTTVNQLLEVRSAYNVRVSDVLIRRAGTDDGIIYLDEATNRVLCERVTFDGPGKIAGYACSNIEWANCDLTTSGSLEPLIALENAGEMTFRNCILNRKTRSSSIKLSNIYAMSTIAFIGCKISGFQSPTVANEVPVSLDQNRFHPGLLEQMPGNLMSMPSLGIRALPAKSGLSAWLGNKYQFVDVASGQTEGLLFYPDQIVVYSMYLAITASMNNVRKDFAIADNLLAPALQKKNLSVLGLVIQYDAPPAGATATVVPWVDLPGTDRQQFDTGGGVGVRFLTATDTAPYQELFDSTGVQPRLIQASVPEFPYMIVSSNASAVSGKLKVQLICLAEMR